MPTRSDSAVIDIAIRLAFIGVFVFTALHLVAPLLGLVLWAVILAVAVHPAHAALSRWLGGRETLSALLLTLVGLVITLGPVAILGLGIVDAATRALTALQSGTLPLPDADRLQGLPLVGPELARGWEAMRGNLAAVAERLGPPLLSAGGFLLGRVAGIGVSLLMLSLSVLIMGLLFKPGPQLAAGARRFANRVFAPRGADLVDLAGATVRNVSRGIIGVAVIQALLAGILMMLFGVPLAGPLAAIALLLAIVQVGPGPVLIPVILWAWVTMGTGTAVLFTALMLPVMVIDNVLKPIFMARGLDTPMLVILVGVLGGMLAYGLVGLFIGPVILAVFHDLLMAWMRAEAPDGAQASDAALRR